MTIETKGWVAQNDKMPGNAYFRVYGTVSVAHPGIEPVLIMPGRQDRSFNLRLELQLQEQDGFYPQVRTEKVVTFQMPGDHSYIPKVEIIHDRKLIASITDIIETH
ncbi:hypothetical protein [Pseudomonas sichuanensis]|jgi:hypothetical protein|uniref:Uncharacterized protein n=1 Tax=Pseudomonas sichuanensis TaxID=2213015 RepID=A0ABV0DLZ7_9PSED